MLRLGVISSMSKLTTWHRYPELTLCFCCRQLLTYMTNVALKRVMMGNFKDQEVRHTTWYMLVLCTDTNEPAAMQPTHCLMLS